MWKLTCHEDLQKLCHLFLVDQKLSKMILDFSIHSPVNENLEIVRMQVSVQRGNSIELDPFSAALNINSWFLAVKFGTQVQNLCCILC